MATLIGPHVSSTLPPMNIDTPEECVADGETHIYGTYEIYRQIKNTNNIILICVIF